MSVAQHARTRSWRSIAYVRPREGESPRCHALADDDWGLYALSEGHGRGPAAEAVAAATLRACARVRAASAGRAGEAECRALIAAVAAEVHHLCASQHAYGSMAASLAVALLGPSQATIGIVGDCVGFVERHGRLVPRVCGQSLLLGPTHTVAPSVIDVPREDGVSVLLATGAIIELALTHARNPSPAVLIEASHGHAPQREAGFVRFELRP